MRRDSIVEEVRKNREAIARAHGNDLDAIVAAFQHQEATSSVPTVSFPARRLVKRASPRKPSKIRRPNKALRPPSRARKAGGQSKGRRRAARG